MYYFRIEASGQLPLRQSTEYLHIPSRLYGFHNTETVHQAEQSDKGAFIIYGELDISDEDRVCPCYGSAMHIHSHCAKILRHIPIGGEYSFVRFTRYRFRCSKCGTTGMQFIPFKARNHNMTEELYRYARDLLAFNNLTNKQVSQMTGLGENVVKDIDLRRPKEKYTIDGVLIKPEQRAAYLGIDEFLPHSGRRYATLAVDLETGHILRLDYGKRKQVVYDFIDHVGLERMDTVEVVACDMNSDFREAFEERCPRIRPAFDHFHLVKNFNDKVVSEVRKDEQKRLAEEGNVEAAKALKKSRYILASKRSALQRKDSEAEAQKELCKGSDLFGTEAIIRKGGNEERYNELLEQNKLLFTLYLIKEKLADAYTEKDEARMAVKMTEIVNICESANCKQLRWFRRGSSSTISKVSLPMLLTGFPAVKRKASTKKSRRFGDKNTDIRMTSISS